MRKQLGAIDAGLVDRLDAERGDVPRTRWLENVITRELDRADSNGRALGAVSSGALAQEPGAPPSDGGLGGTAPAASRTAASPTASPRAPSRTCERCKAPVGSPTMRYHGCGGKVVPPPGRLT